MTADFQALVSPPLVEVSGAPVGACNAYSAKGQPGFEVAALIYTDGAPRPFDPSEPNAHAVAGAGDKAYWVPGDTGIRFEALKGKTQCELKTPHHAALKSSSDADRDAYAQLQAKVCNDMFAAQ